MVVRLALSFFLCFSMVMGQFSTLPQATGGATNPAGNNTQVQYNDAGAFGADGGLAYNKATNYLGVRGGVTIGQNGVANALLLLYGITSGVITVATQDAAGTWTFKLPTNDGMPGDVLTSDGAGNTSWIAPGATGASLPVSLVRDNANQLTLAADCAVTACNFGFGAAVAPISQSAVVTLSANAGTARIYITPAGALTVGYSAAAGIACNAGCTAAPNITAFPSDSIPLYEITYDFAVGGFAATPTNRRSMLSTKVLVQGAGTTLTENGDGSTTVAVDTAAVPTADQRAGAFGCVFTGSEAVADALCYTRVPYACTVTGWSVVAKGTNPTAEFDVWRVPVATTSLPLVANEIAGTGHPTLAAGNSVYTAVANWTSTAIAANDTIAFKLVSIANSTWAQVMVKCAKNN